MLFDGYVDKEKGHTGLFIDLPTYGYERLHLWILILQEFVLMAN